MTSTSCSSSASARTRTGATLATTLLLLFFTSKSYAQVQCPKPDPSEDVIVLYEGCKAPFSGQLFTNAAAIRFGQKLELAEFRIKLLEDELKLRDDIYARWMADQKAVLEEARSLERKLLMDELSRASREVHLLRNPPVWRRGSFLFSSGFGIAVLGAIVLLLVTS